MASREYHNYEVQIIVKTILNMEYSWLPHKEYSDKH